MNLAQDGGKKSAKEDEPLKKKKMAPPQAGKYKLVGLGQTSRPAGTKPGYYRQLSLLRMQYLSIFNGYYPMESERN